MAKVDIKMPDDFLNKLQNLGSDEDGIAARVLEAGAEVVESKVRSNLASVIGRGHNVKIGFAEGRSDGESNAKLANILEYGKHGQPAKPFLKPAKSASKNAAIEAMKQQFEKEVKGR